MPEKPIKNWLIIDWKSGSTRTRQTKPTASSLGTHELSTELTLDVVIPEVDVDELHARVEVPAPRVEQSALDDLEGDDAPDWTDVADEIVDGFLDSYGADWDTWLDKKDSLVLSVIENAPTNPDVEDVRTYLGGEIRDEIRATEGSA